MERYNPRLKQPSRQLRNNSTDAEILLWSKIRMRQLKGLLFYRQKPLGKYIADFYCPKAKPVLEVDGGQHFTDHVKENDKVRDAILGNMGIKVLRSTNDDVMDNIDGVIEAIEGCLP